VKPVSNLSYEQCIDQSIRVTWQLDDILPKDMRLDFSRPHLPEALVRAQGLDFLSASERLALNHIRGNSYMNLFGFVEEYIIPQVIRHAQGELFGDQDAVRALLRFAEEEVKHQALFRRYCEFFKRDYGSPCEVLGESIAVAQIILSKAPMAAMLTTLHLELITQQHYVSSVKDDASLDPLFCSVLKYHWLEESQHARIDTLELEKMAEEADEAERVRAIDEYFDILSAFDGLLAKQVDMDLQSLETKAKRTFESGPRELLRRAQLQSYREDFILMGLRNKAFVEAAKALSPTWSTSLAAQMARYA